MLSEKLRIGAAFILTCIVLLIIFDSIQHDLSAQGNYKLDNEPVNVPINERRKITQVIRDYNRNEDFAKSRTIMLLQNAVAGATIGFLASTITGSAGEDIIANMIIWSLIRTTMVGVPILNTS